MAICLEVCSQHTAMDTGSLVGKTSRALLCALGVSVAYSWLEWGLVECNHVYYMHRWFIIQSKYGSLAIIIITVTCM